MHYPYLYMQRPHLYQYFSAQPAEQFHHLREFQISFYLSANIFVSFLGSYVVVIYYNINRRCAGHRECVFIRD